MYRFTTCCCRTFSLFLKTTPWWRTAIMLVAFGLLVGNMPPAVRCGQAAVRPVTQTEEEVRQLVAQINKLRDEGKYAEAIPLAERLLGIMEKVGGPEHPVTAQIISGLADLYRQTRDYVRAEPLYRRALAIREKILGLEHTDVAVTLNNYALLYIEKSDYGRAEPLLQRALSIYEKAPGANPRDVAATLNSLAHLYMKKGDYARAEPLFRRSLSIAEQALGRDHPVVAVGVNNLAGLYEAQGDYAQAETLYRRALSIREKALGPAHPDVAQSLNNLGLVYGKKGDYVAAEPLFQRSLAMTEKALGPEHPGVAQALNNLAELYKVKGDNVRAESLLARALAIREKTLGPEHLEVALSLNNLAGLYVAKGDYSQAETLFRRSLLIREKALGPAHPDVAQSLNNLAFLYESKGDYVGAEPLYQRSLAVTEKALGTEHPDVADTLNNLAELYKKKGDTARAEPLILRALAIREKTFGPEHPEVALSLNNLADLYKEKGEFARVEPLYQRALAIAEKTLGADHPNVASVLDNLAKWHGLKGDIRRAEMLFQRAIAIREKALGPEHPDLAISLNNFGILYLTQGDQDRAEPMFQRTLTILEKALGSDHPKVSSATHNLASLYDGKGDLARAITFQTRSNDIEERNLALILTTGSEDQKRLYLDTLSVITDFTVSLNTRRSLNSPEATRLALTTILRRKGRALDAASDQIGALRRRLNPQDRELLEQLSTARAQLAKLVLTGPGGTPPALHRDSVARLRVEAERLEAAVSARSTEFRAQTQPVKLERVQEALPAGAALIEFVLYRPYKQQGKLSEIIGAPRYVAYVLPRAGAPAWVDLGEAALIDPSIVELRRALSNTQSTDVKQVARALDEQLMRPVRRLLGETRTVFLSPDGALNLIPFGALVDEQNRYLLENYSITYLTSGRDLLRLQVKAESRQGPVVLANPQFDQVSSGLPAPASEPTARRSADFARLQFGQLKGTAEEAQALGTTLTSVKILTEAQATEAALKRVMGPSILHIATHGFFLPDQPQQTIAETRGLGLSANATTGARGENPFLRSGLALAGANNRRGGDGEDGILTALEAAGLDLWGTRLVVLSACETGIGEVKNGEGVYGLRRALVLAGAESQVLSLWQVSDAATRDLMVAYYKRLQAGEGRTAALNAVQLEMLKSNEQNQVGRNRGLTLESGVTKKDRSHPFFWASFIQSGEWSSLPTKR